MLTSTSTSLTPASAGRFDTIVCLDDLLRDSFWPAKEFIYDLIRHPIFNACGIDIAKSPRHGQPNNLRAGFDAARFAKLCQPGVGEFAWKRTYRGVPDDAASYLTQHLPERALVISYEMPPWLQRIVDAAGLSWIDLRISPLRFGADLYLGLRTNDPALYAAAHALSVPAPEIAAEAALLSARLRYPLRYEPLDPLMDQQCIYIGQTEGDTSLLNDEGRFVRAADHADTLRRLSATGPLQYKPHPLAKGFEQREQAELERITGAKVAICRTDTYELLAREENVMLVGLSSGVLQEAAWFGREAYALFRPIMVPRFDPAHDAEGYLQIASHTFLSQPLWTRLTGGAGLEPPLVFPARPNHLRELHNTWWGYSTALLRHSEFHREAFDILGGAARPDTHTSPLRLNADPRIDALQAEIDGLKAALRVVLKHLGERSTATEKTHA